MLFKPLFNEAILSLCILFLVAASGRAQQKYSTTSGSVSFTSDAELEIINATSDKLQGLIDAASNQFAFSIEIRSFRGFNSEMQREHFNEKYMESENFPRARFSGKIIEQVDFTTPGTYEVRAKGDLEIHGQKQTRIIKSQLTIANGKLEIRSDFIVPLSDHNISIPTIVSQKIATEISVSIRASLIPQPSP